MEQFNNHQIIFEDEHILVLEKPPGLVVDKSQTQASGTLENWLEGRQSKVSSPQIERQGIVHRLDKDTSGLILVAKTQPALENLQNQFQERVVKKEYLALVHGLIREPGIVKGAIDRNPEKREKFTVLETGKEAVTEYTPISDFKFSISNFQLIFNDLNKIQLRKLERMNYNQFTLVRCFPKTGRTHQIRVHLKYIGHPIVSDATYCGRKMYRLDTRWCPRQFLHAVKIGFKHPVSGEWMEFESGLPEDLEKARSLLS